MQLSKEKPVELASNIARQIEAIIKQIEAIHLAVVDGSATWPNVSFVFLPFCDSLKSRRARLSMNMFFKVR